ncbi:hypothetical protein EST38_g6481 [Candolleomyces aberdarensis]|uniref:Uncharacterized protein n=1 Tax=Candolleomyces aberdarensis TaxID=2316362 RepID=A0A4Q2DJL2_9AGAR|nr:hypothetical protein EST38_g6481 [Candolleomyces aberdarensis]
MKKSMLSFFRDQLFDKVPPVATADLSGQTVVVIGANTGLGFEAAKHFARMNPAKLVLACRNEEKGNAAVSKIQQDTGFKSVELQLLDLAKFSSVTQFVDNFLRTSERLDILVANAAVAPGAYKATADGWEEGVQVNNLSTSLLCLLLAPRVVETAQNFNKNARIVVVASEVHYWAKLDDNVLDALSSFEVFGSKEYCTPPKMDSRYFDTKLLNIFFTRSLANLLQNTPVTVNCVNPGFCISNIRREFTGFMVVMDWLMEKILARTTEKGGRQLVWAALGSPENPEDLKGAYVNLHRVEEPSDYVIGVEGKKREDKLWADLIKELAKVDDRVQTIVQDFSRAR